MGNNWLSSDDSLQTAWWPDTNTQRKSWKPTSGIFPAMTIPTLKTFFCFFKWSLYGWSHCSTFIFRNESSMEWRAFITFSVVNQEAKLIGGHVVSSIDNETIWGYFGGMMVEKSWEDSNASTFIEAQYNYAVSDAPYHASALNNLNFTFGVRYYLSRRSF